MKENAKVQTNEFKVNVLVETRNSSNRHMSAFNKRATIIEVLSDNQIVELWQNRTKNDTLELAKN
jgi:hypothetical protein